MKCKENWKSKVQDKSSYKNYKKEIKDLKLRFITGRSQRQVPIFQWQGIGPARTGRSAAPEYNTYFLRNDTKGSIAERDYCLMPLIKLLLSDHLKCA